MNTEVMKLQQTPIIKHKLIEMGAKVSKRIADLNIDKQVATDETVKTLKSVRAELNKEAKEFEEQRKIIKSAILNPYDEFEEIYKEEIISKYKEADSALKTKINEFELKIKKEKRDNLIAYFGELKELNKLGWLDFDRLNIEVNLSTSEKKYKEIINESVKQIMDDLDLISTEKYIAEILVGYKETLNASASIKQVRERKQKEKEEKERLLFERTTKRKRELLSLNFVYSDLTRTYNWIKDESLMVSMVDVESFNEEEWLSLYTEMKTKAVVEEKPKTIQAPTVEDKVKGPQDEEQKEELFEAKFLVKGTYEKIKALGEFLKTNDYEYKNID